MKRLSLPLAAMLVLRAAHLLELPQGSSLSRAGTDAGHVLAFGFLALLWLNALDRLLATRTLPGWRRYLLAFVACMAAGVVLEAVQLLSPTRSANLRDLLRDGAGAAAFLCFGASLSVAYPSGWPAARRKKWLMRAVGLGLVAMTVWPVFYWGATFSFRDRHFPQIAAFESPLEGGLVNGYHAPSSTAGDEWYGSSGQLGLFALNRARYSGMIIPRALPGLAPVWLSQLQNRHPDARARAGNPADQRRTAQQTL